MKTEKFEEQWGPEGYQRKDYYGHERPEALEKVYTEGNLLIQDMADGECFPVESFFDMDKTSMIEHIVEVHGIDRVADKAVSVNTGSKATKEELNAAHNKAHAALDNPMSEFGLLGSRRHWVIAAENDELRFEVGGTPVPTVPHNHEVPVLSTAGAAVRDNKPAGAKPLSAAEAGVLKELVNNDFGGLKQEMSAFASDALAQQQSEIAAEWDEKEKALPDYADQATKAQRKYDEKRRALKAKFDAEKKALEDSFQDLFKGITEQAKADSVVLVQEQESYIDPSDLAKRTRPIYKASVEGRKEALENAAKENKKFLDRALMTLEGQRLAAQRRVLVSRVNPEGAAILDGIPDAKRMMIEAQQTSVRPIASNIVGDDES